MVGLVLGGGAIAVAQETDTIAAVQSDYSALMRKNAEERQKQDPQKAIDMTAPLVSEEAQLGFIDRCWKIHERMVGKPEAFDALRTVMSLAASSGPTAAKVHEQWRLASEKLFTTFADDDRMADLVLRTPAPAALAKEADARLAELKEKTKNANVQAAFVFKPLQEELSRFSRDELDDAGRKALAEKVDELAKNFGAQTVPFRKVSYAEFAKNMRFAMERLRIGGVAPEIEANDLDGVAFKLSDYRGKVVMLDFWGYW
jgi:hypothetical protein